MVLNNSDADIVIVEIRKGRCISSGLLQRVALIAAGLRIESRPDSFDIESSDRAALICAIACRMAALRDQ